jgi:hypothetical protein
LEETFSALAPEHDPSSDLEETPPPVSPLATKTRSVSVMLSIILFIGGGSLRTKVDGVGKDFRQSDHLGIRGLHARVEMICPLVAHIAVQSLVDLCHELDRKEWFLDEMPAMVQNEHFTAGVARH